MEFRVLGPTELWSAGQQFDLGPARERSVLAILLLTPRMIVPYDTLIDRLWGSEPPQKARESLSVYVARIRVSLRQAAEDGIRIAGRANGYVLDIDPESIDLHQFRQLRRQADAVAASGDHDRAATLLREADALWRGQALAGIRGDWAARMRDSLEEERRAAILERVECELELGRHTDLVGELRGLLTRYPLDETFIAHQMTALYWSGRPADALSLYRETRSRLIEEQGAEPGPVLHELHQRILRRDPQLAVRLASPRSGLLATTRSPARLTGGVASPEVMTAFDLAYRALEPDHQRFFRRLGLNPCAEVSLHAAAAIGGCTLAEAEKALAALLDHHLLVRAPAGMFQFHDLIRGYAAVRASQEVPSAERRQAVGRLLDYYLRTADEAAMGTSEDAACWLELEWRNTLQAAKYAGRHEWKRHCADLVHALASFVEVKGYWDEAMQAQEVALQACRDLADQARIARAALDLCVVNQQVGRHEATLALAEEAAAIYQSLADQCGLARALDQVGLVHQRSARSREALAYFAEARTLYSDCGDSRGQAATLSHAGIACWHLGRHHDAVGHLNEALALYRDAGDRLGEGKTLNNLGKMQLYSGYHRDALETYQRSLEIFTEIGGPQTQAVLHHNIGSVYHYKGSYDEGLAAYRRALAIYCTIGDLPDEADVLNDIGAIYQSAECYDEALIHYEKAMLIAEEIGSQAHQVIALRGIADVRRGFGRYDEAFDSYNTALRLAREIGDPYEEAKVLEGIAETTLSTQKPYAARILFRQALDIFSRLEVPEAEAARIRMETTDPALGRRISLPT